MFLGLSYSKMIACGSRLTNNDNSGQVNCTGPPGPHGYLIYFIWGTWSAIIKPWLIVKKFSVD